MNKKLVVLAVAGAFASPLAVQAQTANVTLYGRANIDLEFIKGATCGNGASGGGGGGGTVLRACSALAPAQLDAISNPTVARVSSNSSRFGMRGTESLGGGLNAVFQLESNVSWDSGNSSGSSIASRETFAGLQGSWGKVTMGKFLMPQDDLHPIFGNATTFTTSILSTADVWAQGNLNKGQGGFDARPGNNVRYDSPNISGFTGALQYSTRDSSGNAGIQTPFGGDNGDHFSEMRHAFTLGGNVIYNNGPIQAGVAFETNRKLRQYTADAFAVAGAQGTTTTDPFNADDTDWTITGAYDFGTIMQGFGLRIAGVYEHTKYDTPTGDLKRDFWGVSGTIPAGGGKVYLFYGVASDGKGGAARGESVGYVVKGDDTGVKQWEATYTYNLSPRTAVYAGYVKLANECKAPYTFNINSYAIAVGQEGAAAGTAGAFCSGKPSGVVLGFLHLF
jgi:predicted porin